MRGAGAELQDAAGVGCGDDLGFGLLHAVHFAVEEFQGGFGFGDVVDAGGAAALVGEGHFYEIEAGDGAKQVARSFADFLAVDQVAGILIGDADGERAQRGGDAEVHQKFADVAHFRGEFFCARVRSTVFVEEVRVFLQSGAAAGRVGDDRVEIVGEEGVEILAR